VTLVARHEPVRAWSRNAPSGRRMRVRASMRGKTTYRAKPANPPPNPKASNRPAPGHLLDRSKNTVNRRRIAARMPVARSKCPWLTVEPGNVVHQECRVIRARVVRMKSGLGLQEPRTDHASPADDRGTHVHSGAGSPSARVGAEAFHAAILDVRSRQFAIAPTHGRASRAIKALRTASRRPTSLHTAIAIARCQDAGTVMDCQTHRSAVPFIQSAQDAGKVVAARPLRPKLCTVDATAAVLKNNRAGRMALGSKMLANVSCGKINWRSSGQNDLIAPHRSGLKFSDAKTPPLGFDGMLMRSLAALDQLRRSLVAGRGACHLWPPVACRKVRHGCQPGRAVKAHKREITVRTRWCALCISALPTQGLPCATVAAAPRTGFQRRS